MAKQSGAGEREAAEEILWRDEARRFETQDGKAYLQYRLLAQPRSSSPSSGGGGGATRAAAMDLVHTYVPGSKRGGLAVHLCDAAFAHARRRGMRVAPTCSYVFARDVPPSQSGVERARVHGQRNQTQQNVEETSIFQNRSKTKYISEPSWMIFQNKYISTSKPGLKASAC